MRTGATTTRRLTHKDNWMQRNWRPLAAITYLLICLCDFVVMPVWYQVQNQRNDRTASVELSLKFKDSAAQIAALHEITGQNTWKPITMEGAGLIHFAFGGILGIAAFGRTQEKLQRLANGSVEEQDEKEDKKNG